MLSKAEKSVTGKAMGKNSKIKKVKTGRSQIGGAVTGLAAYLVNNVFSLFIFPVLSKKMGVGDSVEPDLSFLLGTSDLEDLAI